MSETMYSTYQVADLLGTTPAHVAEWMRKGWLPFIRLPDGPVRVSHQVLTHFLQQRGVDVDRVMEHADLTDGNYEGELPPLQPTTGDQEHLSAYLEEPPRPSDTLRGEEPPRPPLDGDHQPGLTALHEKPTPPAVTPEAAEEEPDAEPEEPRAEDTEADEELQEPQTQEPTDGLHDNEDFPPTERQVDHRLEEAILRKIAAVENQQTSAQQEADFAEEVAAEHEASETSPEAHEPTPAGTAEPPVEHTGWPEPGRRSFLPRVFEPQRNEPEPPADEATKPEPPIAHPPQAAAQLLTALLHDAASRGATHLHVERSGKSLRMHWRLDGVLRENTGFRDHLPAELAAPLLEHIRRRGGISTDGPVVPREGRFGLDFEGRTLRCDLLEFRTLAGVKLVLRLSDPHRPPSRLGTLGMGINERNRLESLLASRAGLVLVAVPAGHSAGATLNASAMHLAAQGRGVVALGGEEAVSLPGVTQVSMGPTSGMTESTAIRTVSSADPDAIVLPRLHDVASTDLAIRTALDGRLVVAGITAESGPDAIALLLESGVSPWPLSQVLLGGVAQRTFRRLCLFCRRQSSPTPQAIAPLGRLAREVDFPVHLSGGCEECSRTGFRGETGVFSVLRVGRAMRGLLRRSAELGAICEAADGGDLPHLLADGLRVLREGFTSPDELAEGGILDDDA